MATAEHAPHETTLAEAESFIGHWIKSDHPYSFRSGRWGRVLGVETINDRLCWRIGWEDEVSDAWVIDDGPVKPHLVFTNVPEIACTYDQIPVVRRSSGRGSA